MAAFRSVCVATALIAATASFAGRDDARAVGSYNDALVAIASEVTERIDDAQDRFAHLEPGLRFDAWRSTSLDALANGVRQLEKIRERDDDEGFRAAVRGGLLASDHVIRETLNEGFALSTKETVSNADFARFEALYAELEREGARVDDEIRAAQRAFAASHQMRLIDRKPRKRDAFPDFVAPGIPPESSSLPGQAHVSFAIRYGNQFVAIQNALSRASSAVAQADEAELSAAGKRSLQEVRELRARIESAEPWQGDDTLRAGALEMARVLEESLAGPTAEYAKLVRRDDLEAADVDRANLLVAQMNDASRAAHEAFRTAEATFRQHWATDAYEVWAKANTEFDRARSERLERRDEHSESI